MRLFAVTPVGIGGAALPTDTLASVWIQIDISTTGNLTFRAR